MIPFIFTGLSAFCFRSGGGGIGAFTSDFTNRDSAITRFTLQDNDIYANAGVGVSIGNDGVPVIKGNRFYGGQNAAIYVAGVKAQGTITDNQIYENKDGVVLREGACPHVERNHIHDQTRRGVVVCARGQGMLLDNDICHSGSYNIEVRGEKPKLVSADKAAKDLEKKKKLYAAMGLLVPLQSEGVTISGLLTDESGRTSVALRGNRLVGGGMGSVLLADYAKGFMKGNVLSECSGSAIVVGNGADPEVTDNTITACAEFGLHIRTGGRGRFQANRISENASAGVCLEAESTSDLRANEIFANDNQGVVLRAGSRARVTANTLHSNGGPGLEIEGEGTAQLRDNDIRANCGAAGLVIRNANDVMIVNNEMHNNEAAGVLLTCGASPHLLRNRMKHNATYGVRCESASCGRFERNVIEDNGLVGVFSESDCSPVFGENFVQRNGNDDMHAFSDARDDATLDLNEQPPTGSTGVGPRAAANCKAPIAAQVGTHEGAQPHHVCHTQPVYPTRSMPSSHHIDVSEPCLLSDHGRCPRKDKALGTIALKSLQTQKLRS